LTPTKHIIAGEARNSLKLGSTSPSINCESLNAHQLSLLTLPAERQKKAVNPTLPLCLKKHNIKVKAFHSTLKFQELKQSVFQLPNAV
jgi:hypothetical protein